MAISYCAAILADVNNEVGFSVSASAYSEIATFYKEQC